MLQIKKKAVLSMCRYTLQFLFKNKQLKPSYIIKKQKTQMVYLRSPKHFNIGKQKIITLNYRTPNFILTTSHKIFINSLISSSNLVYKILTKKILLTPTTSAKSIKISVNTKFKLKWLEI